MQHMAKSFNLFKSTTRFIFLVNLFVNSYHNPVRKVCESGYRFWCSHVFPHSFARLPTGLHLGGCHGKPSRPLASTPQTLLGCGRLGCGSVETLGSRQELGMVLTCFDQGIFVAKMWVCLSVWKWGTPIELQFWVWWWCQWINYKKLGFTKCQMQAEWCRPEKSGVLS